MMLGAFNLLNTLQVGMTYPGETVLAASFVKLRHYGPEKEQSSPLTA